jgi:hypothetical protein
MTRRKKRALVAGAVAAVALIAAIAGYAYWTTTGSGSSTATAAGTTAAITVTPSFASGAIYPGVAVPVTFTATNTNPGDVMVHQIVFDHVVTSPSSCLAADFSMATVTEDHRVPTGGGALPTNGSLVLADTSANQDTCKGATVQLFVTSN